MPIWFIIFVAVQALENVTPHPAIFELVGRMHSPVCLV